jgi:type IX secretion system PorP/SprF family membrane protein
MIKYLITALVCIYSFTAIAQDPEFTQFYVNSMYLNPALVGSNTCPTVTSMYRNQWPSTNSQFVTTAVSYDDYIKSLSGGLGIMIMSDKGGPTVLSTSGVSLAYSNHQNISKKWSVRFALQGSLYQEYLDGSKFRFNDQIDPIYGFVYPTEDFIGGEPVIYGSVGTGGILFSDKFFVGYAASHLNRPNESLIFGESRLPIKHTVHAGALLPIVKSYDEILHVSPNVIYRRQGDSQQVNMGLNVSVEPIVVGVWYRGILFQERYNDAIIMSIGLNFNDFNLMYSYDLTISELTPSTGGAHEVSLMYKLPCRSKKDKIRPVPCTTRYAN